MKIWVIQCFDRDLGIEWRAVSPEFGGRNFTREAARAAAKFLRAHYPGFDFRVRALEASCEVVN